MPDETLEDLRREIDAIDHQLLRLVAQRLATAHAIGEFKRGRGLPVHQPSRERELRAERLAYAERLGLEPVLVDRLLSTLLDASRDIQRG